MVKHAINQIIKQIIGSNPIGSLMSLDQTLNDTTCHYVRVVKEIDLSSIGF